MKGKVTIPQTIDITVWQTQTQASTSTGTAALTLAGTLARTSTPIIWGFRTKPRIDKGKGTDLLAVEEGPAALREEVFQLENFQEEEPHEEDPQDQEAETRN